MRFLQGNILKSHGREGTASVFLTFKTGKVHDVREFIRTFADRVTSAQEQDEQSRAFKESENHPSELFVGFHLTAAGYRFLRRSTDGFSKEFRDGLRAAQKRLGDPPVAQWEVRYQRPVHAMVTLAHDYASELARKLGDLLQETKGLASAWIERGAVMRNATGWTIEHFGYVDGRSQPLFFAKDVATERQQARQDRWDSAAGPNLVLVRDPHAKSDQDCGTYVVFRKLEQNVRGFKRQEHALAQRLRLSNVEEKLAEALLVGRFRDGTPLVSSSRENGTPNPQNDFNYDDDRHGNRCPFFSHIRKMNPRGNSAAPFERELSHRIARRGITYGDPTPPGNAEATWPEGGVGLLFQCCQADLANQFEFMQRMWANNPDVPRRDAGQDALVGRGADARRSVPRGWDDPDRVPFDFRTFVRMRGGEYFFAPSIRVLKHI
jgi:Dyp-type peroxidase family